MDAKDSERRSLRVVLRLSGACNARQRLVRAGFAVIVASLAWFVTPHIAQAGLNTWTTAGPGGGYIGALVVDPRTPGVLYVGTTRSVFKSSTGGTIWARANAGLGDQDIADLAIDPETPATLYTAGDAGVFKSTNGGASWSPSRAGLGSSFFTVLAIDPKTPQFSAWAGGEETDFA